jgi:hypothetical protein
MVPMQVQGEPLACNLDWDLMTIHSIPQAATGWIESQDRQHVQCYTGCMASGPYQGLPCAWAARLFARRRCVATTSQHERQPDWSKSSQHKSSRTCTCKRKHAFCQRH